MEPITLTYGEFYLYFVLVLLALGALFGMVPLILGKIKNRKRLGFYGFLASILAAVLSPLGSILVAVIFSWLILKGTNSKPSSS
jgi:hypothetical protein